MVVFLPALVSVVAFGLGVFALEFRGESSEGQFLVVDLGSFFLGGSLKARGDVCDANGGTGFVRVLAAGTGTSHDFDFQFGFGPAGLLNRQETFDPDEPVLSLVIRSERALADPLNCTQPIGEIRGFPFHLDSQQDGFERLRMAAFDGLKRRNFAPETFQVLLQLFGDFSNDPTAFVGTFTRGNLNPDTQIVSPLL